MKRIAINFLLCSSVLTAIVFGFLFDGNSISFATSLTTIIISAIIFFISLAIQYVTERSEGSEKRKM